MSAHEKMRRLLEMLILLSTGVRRTKQELRELSGLSLRTVERYISTFREAGFVIENYGGRYGIDKNTGNGCSLADLLLFSDEEAMILSRAIHALDENNIIKNNLAGKLYALYDAKRVSKVIIHRRDSENVHNLFRAIEEKRQAVLRDYHSAHGGKVKDRTVEPFSFTTNFMNIWCYEPCIHQNRLFKTARIGRVELKATPWQHEENHQEGFLDVFRMNSNERLNVKLRLSMRAAHLLTEEYPLAEAHITNTENGSVFETEVCSYDGVGRFVLGLPGEVEVMETEQFKTYLKQRKKKNQPT